MKQRDGWVSQRAITALASTSNRSSSSSSSNSNSGILKRNFGSSGNGNGSGSGKGDSINSVSSSSSKKIGENEATRTQSTASETTSALAEAAGTGTATSLFYSAGEIQRAYAEIERNVMKNMNESNRGRFRAILLSTVLIIVWVVAVFGSELRKRLTEQTAALASETLENESLKIQTQELASAVVRTVLNDAEVTSKAARFLEMAANTPETQKALLNLTVHILNHPDTLVEVTKLAKELIVRLAADEESTVQIAQLLSTALHRPEVQAELSKLVVWLTADPEVSKAVEELAIRVMNTNAVVDTTNKLMLDSSKGVMEDATIMEQSREFLTEVVADDRLQREGGDALWNTIAHAVKPSAYRVVGLGILSISTLLLKCIISPFG